MKLNRRFFIPRQMENFPTAKFILMNVKTLYEQRVKPLVVEKFRDN